MDDVGKIICKAVIEDDILNELSLHLNENVLFSYCFES